MNRTLLSLIRSVTSLGLIILVAGCGTTHPLPPYEQPIARTEYQTVRTTAYTHTESDHLAYGNHNALGGTLRAAGRPSFAAAAPALVRVANPVDIVDEQGGFHRASPGSHAAVSAGENSYPTRSYVASEPTVYGSAAADWSRWPVGTVFRIESTGQVYRVDDYGWALAGRNTIDLYEATRHDMNAWGVRREAVHILHWGDRGESLRRLRNHQKYRHIRRMVLELEGRERAAANIR